jgi:hypothetical protein
MIGRGNREGKNILEERELGGRGVQGHLRGYKRTRFFSYPSLFDIQSKYKSTDTNKYLLTP